MKVELHLHTSRYSLCGRDTVYAMLAAAVKQGYDAVYLTEHDKMWQDYELEMLRADFPQLMILPGVELSLGDDGGMHLLLLGTNDPKYLKPDLEPSAIIAMAHEAGHFTALAHPFRWSDRPELLDGDILPDALEHRSRNHDQAMAEKTIEAAEKLHLPIINADDAHSTGDVGRFWIETDRPIEKPEDIRDIIIAGEYENRGKAGF